MHYNITYLRVIIDDNDKVIDDPCDGVTILTNENVFYVAVMDGDQRPGHLQDLISMAKMETHLNQTRNNLNKMTPFG